MKKQTSNEKKSDSIENLLDRLKSIANKKYFEFSFEEDINVLEVKFLPKCRFWISLFLSIYEHESRATIQFYIRSTSWDLPGERTDIHDVISQLFACWLRIISPPMSVSIWDVEHPVAQIKGEVYARYLFPEQPSFTHKIDNNFIKLVTKYLEQVHIFEDVLRHCWNLEYDGEELKQDFDFVSTSLWIKRILKSTHLKIKRDDFLIYKRSSPNWIYLRCFLKEQTFSIIKSEKFGSRLFKIFHSLLQLEFKKIESPNGQMFFSKSNGVGNFVSNKTIKLLVQLHSAVDNRLKGPMYFIPITNSVISFRRDYIICVYSDCSRKLFDLEKKQFKAKLIQQQKLLFDDVSLKLSDGLDDEIFEQLCYDLLDREPQTLWIRKVGKSRDRDEGCDLIGNFLTNPINNSEIVDDKPTQIERKVVIQCKAYQKGLSKNKVRDIRDTIDFHEADGYMLICSSYITSSLSQHLLKIKNEGKYWIDWWTSKEIEIKLNLFPDLQKKYKYIIKNF